MKEQSVKHWMRRLVCYGVGMLVLTCGITLNKNCVPGDRRPPSQTSGVRIGTAAMTTKGYTAADFCRVARRIDEVIRGMMAEKTAQA